MGSQCEHDFGSASMRMPAPDDRCRKCGTTLASLAFLQQRVDAPYAPPSFAADPVTSPDSTIAGSEERNGLPHDRYGGREEPTSSGAASAANPAPSLADELQAAFEYGGYFTIGLVVVKNFDFIIAALRAVESDEAKRNRCTATTEDANGPPIRCELPNGHDVNHRGRGKYVIAQWVNEARLKADGK